MTKLLTKFRYIVLLILLVPTLTDARSDVETDYCQQFKQLCTGIISKLQGRWDMEAWGTDRSGNELQLVSQKLNNFKLYFEQQFYYFRYGPDGNLYESYGGTYRVTGADTISETVIFYSPFDRRQIAYGTNGQMIVLHGTSMVGAKANLTLNFENNTMMQTGVLHQTVPEGEDHDMFGPRAIIQKYKKTLKK